jgi:hypothetical protein
MTDTGRYSNWHKSKGRQASFPPEFFEEMKHWQKKNLRNINAKN